LYNPVLKKQNKNDDHEFIDEKKSPSFEKCSTLQRVLAAPALADNEEKNQ